MTNTSTYTKTTLRPSNKGRNSRRLALHRNQKSAVKRAKRQGTTGNVPVLRSSL